MRLVTLQEAKDQLSILSDADDVRIEGLLEDASQIMMDYLLASPAPEALAGWTDSDGGPLMDTTGDPLTDTNGDSLIPGPVRRATLIVLSRMDDDREGVNDPISPAVKSLLMRMCDPPLA